TVFAVNNQGMLAAHEEQHFAHFTQQRGIGHAEHLVACLGWIGEWAKNVEDGTNADFTASRANVLHSGMVGGSEHEAEADLLDAACHLLWAEVDACAKGL